MKYLERIARAIVNTIAIILMTIVALAFILSLTGCGSSSDSDNDHCKDQYSTTSTLVGDSGLLLEPSQHMYVTFEQIEEFYNEVQHCMGVIATGPIVIYTSFRECTEILGVNCEGLGGNLAQYSIGLQLVLMNTDEGDIFARNCETDEGALKHEFVHHLLAASGVSVEDNTSHNSPFFGECGQLN